jgi:hypothetical protein
MSTEKGTADEAPAASTSKAEASTPPHPVGTTNRPGGDPHHQSFRGHRGDTHQQSFRGDPRLSRRQGESLSTHVGEGHYMLPQEIFEYLV